MRVEWSDEALDALADFYVAASADEKLRVATAAEQINRELARSPWEHGESRANLLRRVWFARPLMVVYDIFQADDLVFVNHVAYRPR